MKLTELISEIGINHLGDGQKLDRMIRRAADVGLKSIKFQYRSGGGDFFHGDLEMGSTLVSQELDSSNFGQSAIVEACRLARDLGLSAGVSFFRKADAHDFCAELVPDFIKIPSAEALNFDLIASAHSYDVPVIVSTGGLTLEQLKLLGSSVQFQPIDCVMYCVANYPAALGTSLPTMIAEYRKLFDCRIGYSSHDQDWEVNIAFLAAGIDVLERHLCESKNDPGLDISTSSDFDEMSRLQMFISNTAWMRPANLENRAPNQGEIQNLKDLGSGYYYDQTYPSGSKVMLSDLSIKSPCRGVRAGSIKDFVVLQEVVADAPVVQEDLKQNLAAIELDFDRLISQRISLPVRFHDYRKIMGKFHLANFEFHMSFQDVARIDLLKEELMQTLTADQEFSIHLPDYISSRALIDPFSSDSSVKQDSLKIIDECVEFARFLEDFTSKPCPIVGSFSVIDGHTKSAFYNAHRDLFGKILERSKISIVPQFLPKKAWYFGGSCTLDAFCSLADIEYYREMPSGICLDTAHCIMAANYEKASTTEWLNTLLPLATHVHVSDAEGEDGEGVIFGEGDIGDDIVSALNHGAVKVVEQWEGHLHNFRGFEEALKFLEQRAL